jgi:hypothetical protein
MINNYYALRYNQEKYKNSPTSALSGFKAGDVLVLFGELFSQGYANGLVREAEKRGMKIISATVGRREKDGTLRRLNETELAEKRMPLINIPLEAGFDLETDANGKSPVDYLKDVKLTEWEKFQLPDASLQTSKQKGEARFIQHTREYLEALKSHLPVGANILFAHLMAGGVPRAKVVMPIMNRVVKGTGDRFLSSEQVTQSGVGKLILENFFQVTADTFRILVQETTEIREKWKSQGCQVSYLAYGYHGTEVLINQKFQWQTYTPYIQGWAKMRLEEYSRQFQQKGITTCVYNCPEILTNSSSIFSGVELSLYPLIDAIQKLNSNHEYVKRCQDLLKSEISLKHMLDHINTYLSAPLTREHCVFEKWPQANSPQQLEKMLKASDELIGFHQDEKKLITYLLSEIVFEACGKIMMQDSFKPESPVSWINHDIISKLTTQ